MIRCPPASLSDGAAPETLFAGDEHVGLDHSSVGKTKQLREARPGNLGIPDGSEVISRT